MKKEKVLCTECNRMTDSPCSVLKSWACPFKMFNIIFGDNDK